MKITQIRLLNWCQYEGEHLFDLGTNPDRNVVLIHADNDVGKSSLFYSIAWCLHEQQPDKWEKNNWPLYPLPWFKTARRGEEIRTEVTVTFEHQAALYSAQRTFKTRKTDDDVVRTDENFTFLRQLTSGNWVQDTETRLNRIFPKSVLGYFIFDAEKIEHFVNQNENVQQSVRRLLNIEDAERGFFHLEQVASGLNKEFKAKSNSKAQEYKQQIDQTQKVLNELREELDSPEKGYKAQLKLSKDNRRLIEEELFKHKEAHALLEEEKTTEQAIFSSRTAVAEILKKIKGVTQSLYIALAFPLVQKAFKVLEEKRIRGELPKHIKRKFVVDRIELGKCICGTVLAPGTVPYKEIASFRDTLSDDLSDITQNLNNNIIQVMEKAKSQQSLLQAHMKGLADLKVQITEFSDRLAAVRSKIQNRHDIPDVPQLQIKKEALEGQEALLIRNIAVVETRIQEKLKFLGQLNELLKIELRQQKTRDTAEQDWILATTAQDALKNAIASFNSKARKYLEEQCNIVGCELFWRKDVYKIHIDDDYVITVTSPNTGNRNLLAGMSMGVTHITGLALIAALARQTQAQAPLIMDTPFARLGPAHITNTLSECPKHFRQWILFLQPSEWKNSDYRPVLDARIQKEFTLRRDNMTGITTAVMGYHPEYFGNLRK